MMHWRLGKPPEATDSERRPTNAPPDEAPMAKTVALDTNSWRRTCSTAAKTLLLSSFVQHRPGPVLDTAMVIYPLASATRRNWLSSGNPRQRPTSVVWHASIVHPSGPTVLKISEAWCEQPWAIKKMPLGSTAGRCQRVSISPPTNSYLGLWFGTTILVLVLRNTQSPATCR